MTDNELILRQTALECATALAIVALLVVGLIATVVLI